MAEIKGIFIFTICKSSDAKIIFPQLLLYMGDRLKPTLKSVAFLKYRFKKVKSVSYILNR
jgi:hypothetical protein